MPDTGAQLPHERDGIAKTVGIQWTLVEIESPRAAMFTAAEEWADKARHAIRQIKSWRQLLSENIDYARKPPPDGLGLVDIEPRPAGLILVGRRDGY
jgi:hypothetical protein